MLENLLVQLENNDPTLKKLDLRGQKLNFETLQRIAKALEQNTDLETLDLGENDIDARDAKILAISLEKNKGLKTLFIDSNTINGDDGAQALSKTLEKNTSLEHLYLEYNGIGEVGERALTSSLEKNTSVTILNIPWHNNCKHCENRFKYLERNEKLKEQNQLAIPESVFFNTNIPINNNEEIM